MNKKDTTIARAIKSGRQHLQAGRLKQAESIFRKILKKNSKQRDALYLLGTIALRTGQHQKAIELIRQAINIQPDNPEYFYHLGMAAMALNNTEMALQAFHHALNLKPDYAAVYNDLGVLLDENGNFDGAIESYQNAVKYKPDFSDAYYNLAGVYGLRGNYDAAIRNYEKALIYNPDDPIICNNIGNIFRDMGETPKAMEKYQKAIELEPNFPGAYFNIGVIRKNSGDMEGAIEAFKRVLELDPGYGGAYYETALINSYHEYNPSIQAMEQLLSDPNSSDDLRMYLNFALGKAFEDLKQFDAAFKHFAEGNRMKRSSFVYSTEDERLYCNTIKGVFDKVFFNTRQTFGISSNSPIFIVGMPRSGTTLVEQILASHPKVNGAGEINTLRQVIFQSAPQETTEHFADYILSIDQDDIERFGKEYLKRTAAYQKESDHVTNKLPLNFLFIGMIRLTFPQAKIIHCIRDPIATCLSCFRLLFAGQHPYAYDLQELASYYLLYRDLMTHWHTVLPGYIFENHYENLISDQENQTRKLLDFCGLSWDERCLNFYQTERSVKTASFGQVRRPIYNKAVAFWKHYEKHLDALIKSLGRH